MAYTRQTPDSDTVCNNPGLVSHLCNNSAAETNMALKVPWDNVNLVYGYTAVTTAIDATGSTTIDLELTKAGGTAIATQTIAKSAAVGTITEFTFNEPLVAKGLDRKSTINVEIDGSATGSGQFMLYLYFEPNL